jgi:hypothetical protein
VFAGCVYAKRIDFGAVTMALQHHSTTTSPCAQKTRKALVT